MSTVNDEALAFAQLPRGRRMSNEEANPNGQMMKSHRARDFGHSDFVIPSSFVIGDSSLASSDYEHEHEQE
jgi:hypothetical protein